VSSSFDPWVTWNYAKSSRPTFRRIRHERKLSQEQLAHDAEVDRAYMGRVERAVTYVGLEIIRKKLSTRRTPDRSARCGVLGSRLGVPVQRRHPRAAFPLPIEAPSKKPA
jgi:transcriptional regulator with XRE-family HTH domain